MHPAAIKVEKVNGRLIRKLGSPRAGRSGHYSLLIGGPLPKGEYNMVRSPGRISSKTSSAGLEKVFGFKLNMLSYF